MNRKEIFSYCKNYDEIVTHHFLEEDTYSLDFVDFYQSYVYSLKELNEVIIERLKKLDMVVDRYINDNKFRTTFQKKVKEVTIDTVLKFYEDYKEKEIKHIDNTVWI